MKVLKKLILSTVTAVGAVCLAAGIAACNSGDSQGHKHTFAAEWSTNETSHWHAATCEHTTQKSGFGKHVDSDGDLYCDDCHYLMHDHTFDYSHWEHDSSTHWHAADCGHDAKTDVEPHYDFNDDQFCDECEAPVPHTHRYSETEWGVDEESHWRPATCCEGEKGYIEQHTFVEGECVCGVTEADLEAYTILSKLNLTDNEEFTYWYAALKEDGVTSVRISSWGDVVYDRSGDIEAKYVAQRSVKVKAQTSTGEDLEGVYIKITCTVNGAEVHKYGSSDAIAVGKTGADGIATIEFTPENGYTTPEVIYNARVAQALDVEQVLQIPEEQAFPLPNRYSYEDTASIFAIEVSEDAALEEEVGTVECTYSKGWNAYHTIYLPYRRYWADQVGGTDIQEEGAEYTFTLSGDGLFDYLYFSPQKYDYSQGGTVEQNNKIIDNAQLAASGIYTLTLEVTSASARMYFWNESDNMTKTKSDGTPDDSYVTSITGEEPTNVTAQTVGKYTGDNTIQIKIAPDKALKLYTLGIKCDTAEEVKVTVTREGDYEATADYFFQIQEDGSYFIQNVKMVGYGYTHTGLSLENIPADTYKIILSYDSYVRWWSFAYLNSDEDNCFCLASFVDKSDDLINHSGVIKISETDTLLMIWNNAATSLGTECNVKLEKYESPTLKDDGEMVYIPTAKKVMNSEIRVPLNVSAPGQFTIMVSYVGPENFHGLNESEIFALIKVGETSFNIPITPDSDSIGYGSYRYRGTITVDSVDTTISIQTLGLNMFFAGVTLTPVEAV